MYPLLNGIPYPTISLKGSLSRAMNGRNPNNNEDDGFCNSVMTEVSSNLYRGGATRSQTRAASYAEEAARAQVNTVYLDVLDQVRLIREQIENKQKQMGFYPSAAQPRYAPKSCIKNNINWVPEPWWIC